MSDLISRQAAIDEIEYAAWGKEWDKALAKAMLKSLPSVQPEQITCEGCRHIRSYDTDFPCSRCIRREKDYYEREE